MEMSVDNQPSGTLFGQTLPVGDFQAAIYAQVLTTLGASTCNLFCSKNAPALGSKGGNNYTRTKVPELDTILLKADGELDDGELVKLTKEASKVAAEHMISLPIDPLPNILLWSDKIVGPVADNGLLGPFWNMNLWGVRA
jgi:peptide/nickel transport system substrate-binding protein